jgi:hypothetical protein
MRNQRLFVLDAVRAARHGQIAPLSTTGPRSARRLQWLAVTAITLFASGCIAPCTGGVCNSPASLFRLPGPRFFPTESVINNGCGEVECEKGMCKPQPYLTFNKYRPWFDEWHTTATAKRCANRILLRQQWQLLKLMPADYKKGFRQAFIDVAYGSDGELPAVPPPVYWNAHFRSDAGQRKAECWFTGYRAGSAMAAVQLAPMKRIAASYDWTVQKPKSQFAGGECLPCGLMGQSASNQIRSAGYQPGQPPPLIPGQSFGPVPPQYVPSQYGPPQYGPPPMYPQPMSPQSFGPPTGPVTNAPGGPAGPVESLPAPNYQPAPKYQSVPTAPPQAGPPPSGGLAPGHSVPGPPAVTNPPSMNTQPGSANSGGSLMPGFSGPAHSRSGGAPTGVTGHWGDQPTGNPVY